MPLGAASGRAASVWSLLLRSTIGHSEVSVLPSRLCRTHPGLHEPTEWPFPHGKELHLLLLRRSVRIP